MRQALAICPNQRAALDVKKELECLEGAPRKVGAASNSPDHASPWVASGH